MYLFRHARTVTNDTPEIVGGRTNHAPLTELGERQAGLLGLWIAKRKLVPDAVYVSPAVRTLETARIALERAGIIHDPVVDDRLQELSQGIHEGKLRAEVYDDEVIQRIGTELKDFRLEGGESMNDVAARKQEWANSVRAIGEHRTIFAFTHGFAIRCYVGELLGWSHAEIRANDVDNASATVINFSEDGSLADIQFNLDTQTTP